MIEVLKIQFTLLVLTANIVWFIKWPIEVCETIYNPNKDRDYSIWFIVACVFWFMHAVIICNLVFILLDILDK